MPLTPLIQPLRFQKIIQNLQILVAPEWDEPWCFLRQPLFTPADRLRSDQDDKSLLSGGKCSLVNVWKSQSQAGFRIVLVFVRLAGHPDFVAT